MTFGAGAGLEAIKKYIPQNENLFWHAEELPEDLPATLWHAKKVIFRYILVFCIFFGIFAWEWLAVPFNATQFIYLPPYRGSPGGYVSLSYLFGKILFILGVIFIPCACIWFWQIGMFNRGYALLSEWYSDDELTQYPQFIAVTPQHIIKKDINVVTRLVFPRSMRGKNLSLGPIPENFQHVLSCKQDVEIMSIAALTQVNRHTLRGKSSDLLEFSFADPAPSQAQAQKRIVAESTIRLRSKDADEFIAVLTSLNFSLKVLPGRKNHGPGYGPWVRGKLWQE